MQPDTRRDELNLLNQSIVEIKRVPMPQHDPITGGEGAVTEIWHPLEQN
jgi:uncharacterized protein YjlB